MGASLLFNKIQNWGNAPNILYVNMLDRARSGLWEGVDHKAPGNMFAHQGSKIVDLVNLPPWPQDIGYHFNEQQIEKLKEYSADGNFGFGLDPDCHYFNDGVTLEIYTAPAPEFIALMLLSDALVALILIRRRKVT